MCVQLLSHPTLQLHGLWTAGFLCPWDFPGKNTEVTCLSFSRRSSHTGDRTCISCVSCIDRWVLYTSATWEAHIFVPVSINKSEKISLNWRLTSILLICQKNSTKEVRCSKENIEIVLEIRYHYLSLARCLVTLPEFYKSDSGTLNDRVIHRVPETMQSN